MGRKIQIRSFLRAMSDGMRFEGFKVGTFRARLIDLHGQGSEIRSSVFTQMPAFNWTDRIVSPAIT